MDRVPYDIVIYFGDERVTLPTADDVAYTKSGVKIYMQKRPDRYKPMAEIPDGTLEDHMHDRPIVHDVKWTK